MKYDQFGQAVISAKDLVSSLYRDPLAQLERYQITDPEQYNSSIDSLHLDWQKLARYSEPQITVQEFDSNNQTKWFMPSSYAQLDIAEWVLSQCKTDEELQRVADELLRFQERNLFPLLCYLKYLVDTMRDNQVLWGVGRGSSVASYVLYLIGVHKINSLYYDLDIQEFLKD